MAEEKKFIEATEVKQLKSDTKVTAVHIKWNKQHFHVVKAFHGRLGWMLSGFHATNRGLPIHSKLIFFYMGDDIDAGVDHMLNVLNGVEEPKKQTIQYR
jgi:hypothetical protein